MKPLETICQLVLPDLRYLLATTQPADSCHAIRPQSFLAAGLFDFMDFNGGRGVGPASCSRRRDVNWKGDLATHAARDAYLLLTLQSAKIFHAGALSTNFRDAISRQHSDSDSILGELHLQATVDHSKQSGMRTIRILKSGKWVSSAFG